MVWNPGFLDVTEWNLCCCVFLVGCCDVHPCFSLKDLGVEEAQNWLINLVKRGTSPTDQEGLEYHLCTPKRALEGKVWPKETV